MAMTDDGLSPDDFAATAARAIAACAGRNARAQARCLADDGLLGVLACEDVGGLGLPLAFAVPVVTAASAGLLGFPLPESILVARLLQQQLPQVAEAVVSGSTCVTIAWAGQVTALPKHDSLVLNGWVGRA